MLKNLFILLLGLVIGGAIGFYLFTYKPDIFNAHTKVVSPISTTPLSTSSQIIGFLPYWLIGNDNKDYTPYITTLSYFSLAIDADGTIQKFASPGESEPGWYSLQSGKVDPFLKQATDKKLTKSLVVFSSNEETINQLISDPQTTADNLINDVAPVMKKYGFSDLNLDIESVIPASDEARLQFTAFVKNVKRGMNLQRLGTLTVDVAPIALIKKYLIDVKEIGAIADHLVLMTYDYHYSGSIVTGAVSPVGGAGIDAEYDTETAIREALRVAPANKIIIGVPFYGYEWETLSAISHSATIPDTGLVASAKRVEALLQSCKDCAVQTDSSAKEPYLTYFDKKTNTYHQIYYPDKEAVNEKVNLTINYGVGGVAVWALGYESSSLLDPLANYKKTITTNSSLF